MKVIEKIREAAEAGGGEGKVVFSFEFFPPKTEDGVDNLFDKMERMVAHNPTFCDITWGAGGSTADLTLEIANRMQNMVCVETMMHLTCTNMPVDKIDHALQTIKSNGIQNVLALRGDPPHGQDKFVQIQGGFACALDLVKHMRSKYGDYFGITVAGYPEAHPDVIQSDGGLATPEAYQSDLAYLKRKVDAGADVIVTQLFYDTDIFLKFVNDCRQIGITCPIVPGIMPINNYKGFIRMTGFCKTKIPAEITAALEPIKENEEAVRAYGIHLGTEMCKKILANGIKTIQAITYLTLLKHLEDDPGPHLIVCPASVLENWERELKKWCPSFSVLQYHGAGRAAYSKELSSLAKAGLPPPFNVILVCYTLFERHSAQQKDDRKVLKRWQWSCVLMDEAHALKDKSSYRWKNLMSVARNANQRLMLTGTPLQNDLHELWSLLEFMMPDLFDTGDVDLKKLLNSEDRDLISRMKSIMGPFILRRLKSDVMEQLAPKEQWVEYVEMVKQQDVAYKEAVEECRARTVNNNGTGILPQRQISNYFVQFRKIANHPLLVRRIYTDEDVVRFAKKLHPMGVFGFECTLDRVIEELKSYNDFTIHRLLLHHGVSDKKGVLSDEHVMISAKCQALSKILPKLKRKGHRVLIFSQWTSMLDILEWTLEVIGVTYRRLDGSTRVTERQTIVDTFNNDQSIFACLLSTRAGGQGLNLIGADTVVIHDMDFNPQIDRQAEDRCHRIGQTKPVTIYRLVTKGTVDENVYEIAKRKLVLDAAVLESGEEVKNEGDVPDNKTMGEILSSLLLGS